MYYMCEDCKSAMRSGRLRDLVTSAPNVEELDISLQTCEFPSQTDFEATLGKFTWTRLRSFSISGVNTTEEDLMNFLERHARALQVVNFSVISLESGSWIPFVRRMQKSLNLKCALFHRIVATERIRELAYSRCPCLDY